MPRRKTAGRWIGIAILVSLLWIDVHAQDPNVRYKVEGGIRINTTPIVADSLQSDSSNMVASTPVAPPDTTTTARERRRLLRLQRDTVTVR